MRQKTTVIRGRRATPKFRSMEKESSFWDGHGALDFCTWEAVPYEWDREEPKISVTLRMERALLRKLKVAARRHGVKYQALAREILWRSLSRRAQ